MTNKRKLLKNTKIDTITINVLFPVDYNVKKSPSWGTYY